MDADKEQIAEVLGRYTSADTLTEVMTRLHENMGPTYHRLSNFVINVDGDRATAHSYVHALLMLQPDDPTNWVDALGHYDDVFVRTPDGWRMTERVSRTARTLAGGDLATAAVSAQS